MPPSRWLALGLGLAALLGWRVMTRPTPPDAPTIELDVATGGAESPIATDAVADSELQPERVLAAGPPPATPTPAVVPALAGHVVDLRTRARVANARLSVRDIPNGEGSVEPPAEWQAMSDAQGAFSLECPGSSVVELEVTADGYVPRKLASVVVRAGVEIGLQPASRLVLEVRLDRHGDGLSSEPVEGAACRLVLDGDSSIRRTIQHGLTDARGEVVFALRDRQAHVAVEVPDLPSFGRIYELKPGQDRVVIVLQPVGELSGRVIDKHSRRAIAGATLTATYREDLRAVTDADGQFRIPHDHTENSLWTVSHPDHATVYQRMLPQPRRVARVPDIELDASAVVVGRLEGFQGEIQLTVVSQQSWFAHQRFRQHRSLSAAGPVRVVGVPPREELVVEARDRHGNLGVTELPAAAPGATVDFGTLMPMPTAALYGRLIGLDPSLPAVVRVQVKRGELNLRDLTLAVDGAEYRVRGLPLGPVAAWIEQEGAPGVVAKADLTAGERSLDLDLGGKIRGTVRDESGVGIASAIAQVTTENPVAARRDHARSDPTGSFTIAGLDRATLHRVSIVRAGGPGTEVTPKSIEGVMPDGPPVQFTVRRNHLTITGEVSGVLLATVKADLLRVQGQCENKEVSATLQDDGTFSLSVPHFGPWNLRLFALNVSGETLGIEAMPGVEEIRDVSPGHSVVFRPK